MKFSEYMIQEGVFDFLRKSKQPTNVPLTSVDIALIQTAIPGHHISTDCGDLLDRPVLNVYIHRSRKNKLINGLPADLAFRKDSAGIYHVGISYYPNGHTIPLTHDDKAFTSAKQLQDLLGL
jgi:hypothetical protein